MMERYKNILKARYRTMFSYIGFLVMGVGFFGLLPLATLFFFPEERGYLWAFLLPAAVALSLGCLFWLLFSSKEPPTLSLTEGGIIVLFIWCFAICFSMLPFLLAGILSPLQALFESVSGWTTTGLSVMDVTQTANIFLLWRSIMQLLGGAGLVIIMLSAIIGPHGLGLYQAEGRSQQLLPHVRRSAKMILTIYSGYVLAGILLYRLLGMSLFDAINHSMAALSTGGFSTKVNSIGEWNSLPLELCTIVLMLLGSMNFATHYLFLRGKFRSVLLNGEIQLLLFIIAFLTPVTAFLGLRELYPNLPHALRVASFQVISAFTTTGFSTVLLTLFNAFSILVLVLLMIIGAATNSTGGGIKLYRIYLLIKSLLWEIRQYFIPRSAISMHYIWHGENKFYVEASHIREVANYTFLFLGTYFVGVMIFLVQGYPLAESMFEFASALGTVGLSIGITAKDAPPLILWTEIAGMFLGRLEFYVIFFALIKLSKDLKLFLRSNKKKMERL